MTLIRKQRPDARISIADAYQECLDRAQAKIGEVEATYLLPETKLCIDQCIDDRFDVVRCRMSWNICKSR